MIVFLQNKVKILCSKKKFENVSWTTGFYEGILWLMYELTGDKSFL